MKYPKIYLSIDNCFASKRWNTPEEWVRIAKEIGLSCVEASADNECDPLYTGTEFLQKWVPDVRRASETYGVKTVNLYSGHGTYSTLGLSHTDPLVRERMLNQWLKPMASFAGELHAGLGFFCHAFPESVLQDKNRYEEAMSLLLGNLAELASHATERGCAFLALEQMYSPHQVPFTIAGAADMVRAVSAAGKMPFYITVDVGHQTGQRRFLRPDKAELEQRLADGSPGWLGTNEAYGLFGSSLPVGEKLPRILEAMEKTPWLFASPEDCDTDNWLSALGCYSPIIHLQQSDGKSSGHKPFTKDNNERGIIDGKKLLTALRRSYDAAPGPALPPRCEEIYLTLEIFSETAAYNHEIIKSLSESVEYWRTFVPRDGLPLDELTRPD